MSSEEFLSIGFCATVSKILCPVWGSPVQEGHERTKLGEERNTVRWNPSHFLYPECQCGMQVPTMVFYEAYLVLFEDGFLDVKIWAF